MRKHWKANIDEAFKNCFEDTVVEEKSFVVDVANRIQVVGPGRWRQRKAWRHCEDSLNSLGSVRHLSCGDVTRIRGDQELLPYFRKHMIPKWHCQKTVRRTYGHDTTKLELCFLRLHFSCYMAGSVSRQDEPGNSALWLAGSARDYALYYPKKNSPESHIINPLLTKLARSRQLGIGLLLFLRVYGPRLRLCL